MTWSLLPKFCKQNKRQYHNWRGKSNSTFLHELPHTMFFLDDQKTGMFRKGPKATGWLKSGFGQTPGLDRGRHFGKRWPKQTLSKKKYWWQRELIFMRILSPHTRRLPRCPLLNPLHHQLIFYHWANIKWPFFLQKIESFHGLQLIFWRQLDMDIVVLKTHFLWTSNRVSCKGCYRTLGNQDWVVCTF